MTIDRRQDMITWIGSGSNLEIYDFFLVQHKDCD